MKSLPQKILALVPRDRRGLSLKRAIESTKEDTAHVRSAFDKLAQRGAIQIVKRGRGSAIFAVLPELGVTCCAVCQREFQRPPKSKRQTCSRYCHAAFGWRDPEKAERRRASLSAAQSTPKALARTAATNKKRWAKPEEHEKLHEQNKRRWRDPEMAAVIAAKIRVHHGQPEVRKFYSDMRKKMWANPAMRKKMQEAAAASKKVQAYRAKMSKLVKERWNDPYFREKWTAANKARNTPELRAANSKRMKERHAKRRAVQQHGVCSP